MERMLRAANVNMNMSLKMLVCALPNESKLEFESLLKSAESDRIR